eukprot:g5730.t1
MAGGWLARLTDFRKGEQGPALMAAAYFFCLMFGYFLLRPLREALGLEGGVDSLRLLFLITLCVMLVVNIGYGWLVSRLPRKVFVPMVYRIAIACLLVFTMLLVIGQEPGGIVGRVFYVWLSVFNLLAISVFWALMADTFTLEQGKRLFGFIGVGGTLGAIAGSALTWRLAGVVGPVGLMVAATVLIELAAQIARVFARRGDADAALKDQRVGGAAWRGLLDLVRSPYLAGIGAYVMLYTILSTLLYFEKMRIVDAAVEGVDSRAGVFAGIELAGQTLTVVLQLLLTGRLMRLLGVGALLAAAPVVTIAGFGALLAWPTLGVVTVFEATRRASNFALSKPARETLFTVVSRDEKYKAKGAIDTFVYRGGDAVGTLADKGVALLAVPAGALAIPLRLTMGGRDAKPLKILFLGGTGMLGPHFIELARARGHEITLFNRGNRAEMFPGLELIEGNRIVDVEPGLAPLEEAVKGGRTWDAVIDTASVHTWVENSAAILKDAAEHYQFISSLSAYASTSGKEQREGDAVASMPDDVADGIDRLPYNMQYYGAVKARSEAAAERHFPGRATVLRPGLIVGPRDFTHRFTYWPYRVREGGEVLAPGWPEHPIKFIDARDVAAFMLRTLEDRSYGIYNTNGPVGEAMTIGTLLDTCKAVTGSGAEFTWVDADFLSARGINGWVQMPVWLPPVGAYSGFHATSLEKAAAAGLVTRPLEQTIRDTLAWFDEWREGDAKARGFVYEPGGRLPGITPEQESETLKAWHEREAPDREIGVGVIGLGFIGATHLRAFSAAPGARVVAVCDADADRLDGRPASQGNLAGTDETPLFDPDRVAVTTDPDDLLRDDGVGLVCICTPTDTHVDLAIRALDAGRHVLVEKPVAITRAEVGRLADHARARDQLCVPAMCVRYWPGWDRLPELISSGRHGRVLSARFERLGAPPAWSSFYADAARSGDALFDLHIHDVDMVHRCFGAPTGVRSIGRPGHVLTSYAFGGDAPPMVCAEGGWLSDPAAPFRMRFVVEFERALCEFDLAHDPPLSLLVGGEQRRPGLPRETGWEAQARAIVAALRTGDRSGLATMDEALEVTRTIESELASLKGGQAVRRAVRRRVHRLEQGEELHRVADPDEAVKVNIARARGDAEIESEHAPGVLSADVVERGADEQKVIAQSDAATGVRAGRETRDRCDLNPALARVPEHGRRARVVRVPVAHHGPAHDRVPIDRDRRAEHVGGLGPRRGELLFLQPDVAEKAEDVDRAGVGRGLIVAPRADHEPVALDVHRLPERVEHRRVVGDYPVVEHPPVPFEAVDVDRPGVHRRVIIPGAADDQPAPVHRDALPEQVEVVGFGRRERLGGCPRLAGTLGDGDDAGAGAARVVRGRSHRDLVAADRDAAPEPVARAGGDRRQALELERDVTRDVHHVHGARVAGVRVVERGADHHGVAGYGDGNAEQIARARSAGRQRGRDHERAVRVSRHETDAVDAAQDRVAFRDGDARPQALPALEREGGQIKVLEWDALGARVCAGKNERRSAGEQGR